jgi:hypothetical protein
MKRVILIWSSLFCSTFLLGQSKTDDSSSGRVLEGAKVVLEIIKLVQRDKADDKANCEGKSDVCFENKSKTTVKVELGHRSEGSIACFLIIQPDKSECKLDIPAGVYGYTVSTISDEQLLNMGDLRLRSCKKEKMVIE